MRVVCMGEISWWKPWRVTLWLAGSCRVDVDRVSWRSADAGMWRLFVVRPSLVRAARTGGLAFSGRGHLQTLALALGPTGGRIAMFGGSPVVRSLSPFGVGPRAQRSIEGSAQRAFASAHAGSPMIGRTATRVVQPGARRMTTQTDKASAGPWVLPVVCYRSKQYFVDLRLSQFREIEKPHNSFDFDGGQGRQMCRQGGVTTCPTCGMSAIISTTLKNEELRCMRCFARILR